jgi:hypothetical protein
MSSWCYFCNSRAWGGGGSGAFLNQRLRWWWWWWWRIFNQKYSCGHSRTTYTITVGSGGIAIEYWNSSGGAIATFGSTITAAGGAVEEL